ncbi:MAG: type II toxin-antitoxin system VapC family toxin [Nitrospinota bacterium]
MRVFVDTSAWVALYYKRDQYHEEAANIWKGMIRKNPQLYTTDYVFDETVTLLRKRAGYYPSKVAGDSILKSPHVEIIFIGKDMMLKAWEVYEKYKDHDLSFTDCTSIAVMNVRGIKNVFGFDSHFGKVGFTELGKEDKRYR